MLVGRIRLPNPGGSVEGVSVELFICEHRTTCLLMDGEAFASTITGADGRFTFTAPETLVQGKLLVLGARVGVNRIVRVRTIILVVRPVGSTAAQQGARQIADLTDVVIDPISEAGVRLLAEQGLENFTNEGAIAVLQAVREANAETVIDQLPLEESIDLVMSTAETDPVVQMILQENRLTPTPTVSPGLDCVGDCDGDDLVTINEIVTMINIALGNATSSACAAGDPDGKGGITIDEIIAAVGRALNGCV
jgi:hypothetical protein